MGEGLDPTATPGTDPADTTGTPDPSAGDTGTGTPADTAPVDWQKRYNDLRPAFDRASTRVKELEDRILAANRTSQPTPHPDPATNPNPTLPPDVERELSELRTWREQQEWAAVQAEVGEPLMQAYQVFHRGWQLDNSPRGALRAFKEAVEAAAAVTPPPPAGGKPTRQQVVEPKVDANRSDGPDQTALDKAIEDAKAGKGKDPFGALISARLRKAGL